MKPYFLFITMAAAALAQTSGSWTGTVTDSMCVNDHAMMNTKAPDGDCVRACIKSNPSAHKYILSDGKNTYKLSDQKAPEQFAAKKVTVKGTLYPKTGVIKVDSIQAAR
jgi:3-methyladenine DNA glycosylase AlkD